MLRFLILFLTLTVFVDFGSPMDVYSGDKTYYKLRSMKKIKMEGIERQTRDYSCGAASLVILLKNYFNISDYNESILLKDIIFRLSDTEIDDRLKDGFSMLDLKHLVERLGLIGDGVILPKEALNKLKGPIIILLEKNDIKHFVVLKGVYDNRAFIADPVAGHYSTPLYELGTQWKGHAFIVGRPGFGLPQKHGLTFAKGNDSSNYNESAHFMYPLKYNRKMLHSPFNK